MLLVEDSPELRQLTRAHLLRLGLDVTEAGDGRHALGALATRSFDLVCLDLMLPEVSGYEICERIRANDANRNVPILVISARSSATDRAHALEAGADAVLVKPFRANELRSRVAELLTGAQKGAP
ncbi:MAG: response regulator [Deltaproteobacteria bacterium]|nr:response regulator [Deltaproteobacteria bacterium]